MFYGSPPIVGCTTRACFRSRLLAWGAVASGHPDDDVTASDPQLGEPYGGRGLILDDRGEHEDALRAHDQAAALEPANPRAHMWHAWTLSELHKGRKRWTLRTKLSHSTITTPWLIPAGGWC